MRPPPKAADLSVDMRSTGLNHIAFDVGPAMKAEGLGDMKAFLSSLNSQVRWLLMPPCLLSELLIVYVRC